MKAFLAGALVLAWPCAAMAQIAVLQIKILDGEGAVHQAGARIAHPLTVEVTDETGKPVAGAAVTFQLPPEGPSGLFSNGLRMDLVLTDAAGRAALHSIQVNRSAGQFRIRITAVKEQTRAGAISLQYIAEGRNSVTAATAKPDSGVTAAAPARPQAPPQPSAKSGEITPTTTKMASASHKKWIVLGIILAAGGAAAFAGISHASAATGTVSSGVVSVGTPTITIGHP